MTRKEIEKQYGQAWDTTELQEDFSVEGFGYGLCVVKRRADGQRGSLEFQHRPRFYHSFREA